MSVTVLRRARGAHPCALLAAAAGMLLAACSGSGLETASLSPEATPKSPTSRNTAPAASQRLAEAHAAKPGDVNAAFDYARSLRQAGGKAEALAVLDGVAEKNPADKALAKERGLLALELGDTAKAERLLKQSLDAKAPDWHVHSALGVVLSGAGRQPEAQAEFAKALALAPEHPTVLNNLALSYALDGKSAEAEKLLRRASGSRTADSKVKQNLALVVGLAGRTEESRAIAGAALSEAKAEANAVYLKSLLGETGREEKAKSASLPPPAYHLGVPPAR